MNYGLRNPLRQALACGVVGIFLAAGLGAVPIVLIDEDFYGGAQPTNTSIVTWSDSDGGGFETYKSAKA